MLVKSRRSRKRRVGSFLGGAAVLTSLALHFLVLVPARLRDNERAAAAALKTLATAEADFRSNDRDGNRVNDYWTADVTGLFAIQSDGRPIALIDRAVAEADASPVQPLVSKPVPYHGYYFVALRFDDSNPLSPKQPYRTDTDGQSGKVHNNSCYGFCAYPAEYGRTGRMTFVINEGNTMFKRDTAGKPEEAWPQDSEFQTSYWR